MATIPIIQLLRNNNIYSSRDAARSALEGQKNNVPDGGLILATYSSDNGVKTLLGIVRNSGSENAKITIMDVEGAAANVQKAIDALSAYTNTKLTEEKNAREAADTTLQNNIDALSLSTDTKINAEVTRATKKEAELSSTITSNYTTLSTAIDDEKKRAEAQETALNSKIESIGESLGNTNSATVASGEYSSQDKKIYLKNISGETLSEIDATDFIKDGMVSNVEVADGNLKISFNTDAGHEDINIPISAIFNANNYYTKSEVDAKVDDINSTVEAYGQVTSQALNDLGTRMDDYGQVTSQSLNDLSTKFGDYYTKTEVDSKDATLQTAIDALSSSTDTKIANEASARQSADTTLQSNIDALSGDTKSKIDAEAQTREAADTTLQGNIDNVNSALTVHTANTTVHVTQADKDKWNTPTDLSNYYNKQEVDEAIANVDVTEQLQNYYTKSEVDEKDAVINSTIEAYGHVTSQALNDLGTRMDDYGQVTSQALNDLGTKFGDYYTKTEVDSKDATINATIEALDGSLGDTVSTTVASGEYSSTDKAIYLKNISGKTLSTIDATNFIKDGMVSNVEVADGNLKISFNTDAGHEDINIPISAIFNANNYYTKTEIDTKVDDINSQLSEYGQTTSQALNDLATRLTEETSARESGDTTLQNNINALSSDTKTKIDAEAQARTSGDTTLQGNIDALSSSTDTKIANETTARQEADTTLQTNINNVNSSLTAHTANTTVHVTQADKDKWNTPTDLSNYYTKEKVDEKDAAINSTIESYGQVTSQALNDLGTRMDDYGQVTSQSLNDLSTKFGDYYTKTEVDTAISNVDVTEQLQNYYTKAEVDSKDSTLQTAINALSGDTKTKINAEIAAREAADNALQTAIDALDAHVNENEDIVSKSLNDLNNRIGNTYVKSYIDALEARIAELETKFLNMENNGLQAGEY